MLSDGLRLLVDGATVEVFKTTVANIYSADLETSEARIVCVTDAVALHVECQIHSAILPIINDHKTVCSVADYTICNVDFIRNILDFAISPLRVGPLHAALYDRPTQIVN